MMLVENRRRIPLGVALVLLVLTLSLSACSLRKGASADPFETIRTTIDQEVADGERQAKMKAITTDMESTMNELREVVSDQEEALDVLIADYDSTESDFQMLFSKYLEKRDELSEQYLSLRLELKEAATADEWEKLTKAEHEAVKQTAHQTIYPSTDD